MDEKKWGLALLPRKPSLVEVNNYVEDIGKAFPDAKILIATGERQQEDTNVLHANPRVSILHTTKERLDIVAGGYCLMAAARALELERVFFNTGMLRYDATTFTDFIKTANPSADLVFGVPPILQPDKANREELSVLDKKPVRCRLLVDLFLNYAFTSALDMEFTNLNAGMFGVKRAAIKYLLSVSNYDDSSLLCSQMCWHLKRSDDEFMIRSVPCKRIRLDDLGFSLEKAVREVRFVLLERQKVAKWIPPRVLANSFFSERAYWNRWVRTKDAEWFFDNIIPQVEKSLRHKPNTEELAIKPDPDAKEKKAQEQETSRRQG